MTRGRTDIGGQAMVWLVAVLVVVGAVAYGTGDTCWDESACPAHGQTGVGAPVYPGTVEPPDAATPDPAPSATSRPPSASRSVRSTDNLTARERRQVTFEDWLASPTSRKVQWRESNNRCDVTNPSGKYQGKWQMDDNFWKAYGGRRYAANPHQATCHEQDLVAYRGWLARGWNPWTTA